jgi:RNA polymerase sigma factor (sigma-70 family)
MVPWTTHTSMVTHSEDLALAQACLAGEDAAWSRFEAMYRTPIVSLLMSRGAGFAEAEDLVAELLMDLGGFGKKPEPLLKNFLGTGPLKSWLSTIAMMRLIAVRRRKRLFVDLSGADGYGDLIEHTEAPCGTSVLSDLQQAMRRSLLRAWRQCPAEMRVMLQLLHIEAITQREIARLWGWHESKVCRTLDAALRGIRKATMAEIKSVDPEALLQWRDFVELGNLYESVLTAPADEIDGVRLPPAFAA